MIVALMSHDHHTLRELSKYEREGSFPEKKNYKPNVRIIHVDDSGRELTIKEVILKRIPSVKIDFTLV